MAPTSRCCTTCLVGTLLALKHLTLQNWGMLQNVRAPYATQPAIARAMDVRGRPGRQLKLRMLRAGFMVCVPRISCPY